VISNQLFSMFRRALGMAVLKLRASASSRSIYRYGAPAARDGTRPGIYLIWVTGRRHV
jgi:hypothetical protein